MRRYAIYFWKVVSRNAEGLPTLSGGIRNDYAHYHQHTKDEVLNTMIDKFDAATEQYLKLGTEGKLQMVDQYWISDDEKWEDIEIIATREIPQVEE